MPGLALSHLLGAAMVKSNLRHRIHDLFSVQLQNDAQNTVRARMLRPDIQEKNFATGPGAPHAPFLRAESKRLLLGSLFVLRKAEFAHLRRPLRVIFA